MIRHASAEDLASLDLGGLKPRKTAKIQAHMATCAQCTELSSELAVVPATLASVSYPAMPESLSVQIESALATESAQRLAAAPPTEAGRRDLPERARHARRGQRRGGWQLPGMSVVATRIVAAAGALVVVGVGGYEIATHVPSSVTGTAASSSGSAAASGGQLSFGPNIQYGAPASHKTVRAVNADTNFTSAKLGTQALAALHAARPSGALPAQRATGSVPSASAASANSSGGGTTTPGEGALASCLGGIAGNQSVLLVETAKFEGKPATIIITALTATSQAEVWVVGPACTASHPDVLDHLRLSRT